MDTTNKKIIPIEVRDEYILGSGVSIGAMGSFGTMVLRATFDESWVGLTKYATWTDALGNVGEQTVVTALDLVDEEPNTYYVPVPSFATNYAGAVKLSFTGYLIGDDELKSRINTVSGVFRVLDSNAVPLSLGGGEEIKEVERLVSDLGILISTFIEQEEERKYAEGSLDEASQYYGGRVEAEEARVIAEIGGYGNWYDEEKGRVRDQSNNIVENANAGRVGAELERVLKELARETAENKRANAEVVRDLNENERRANEKERQENESIRRSEEEFRKGNEIHRQERIAAVETFIAEFKALVSSEVVSKGIPQRDSEGNIALPPQTAVYIENGESVAVSGAVVREYVSKRLTEIIGEAPEALDTLHELAAALNDDEYFAAKVNAMLTEHNTALTEHSEKLVEHEERLIIVEDLSADLGAQIGDIDAALSTIISIKDALLENGSGDNTQTALIEFTIDGVTYQAEEDTTWEEWVDSEYNPGGYSISDSSSYVVEDVYGSYVTYDGERMMGNMRIGAGDAYEHIAYGAL